MSRTDDPGFDTDRQSAQHAPDPAVPDDGPATLALAAQEVHAGRLRWWREVVYITTFFLIYSWTRNQFGSASLDSRRAYEHAKLIIDIESFVGLYHEATIQSWFLGHTWFIQFWNVFYGTFHFAVTIGVFIWLFARRRSYYAAWRNTLAFTTALALIGFSLFPLMPPRLLCDDCDWGAGHADPAFDADDYPFVDTLDEYGGLWSFNRGNMSRVSNQYAAMPSLHFAWSAWCAMAIWSLARHRWARLLAALYPLATLFAVVVTANHFWLDAVGGALVLGVGWVLGTRVAAWNDRRIARELVAPRPRDRSLDSARDHA